MDYLSELEHRSIHILREAYSCFERPAMLWSMGKDSTVLLWLTRKAFFGHVPFPLIHIDTSYKIPEMIDYRDRLAREWKLDLIVAQNTEALERKQTFPEGNATRIECCNALKTQPLSQLLLGKGNRRRFNHQTGTFEKDQQNELFDSVIVGLRSDEEGTRSKERYFSPRDKNNDWEIAEQPPEFWSQFNTEAAAGTHVRVHPLLDWTEIAIWEYIERYDIPTVSLYYDKGTGSRYRSLGCECCTNAIASKACKPSDIIVELTSGSHARIAERAGRAQDKEGQGGLEALRKDGYM